MVQAAMRETGHGPVPDIGSGDENRSRDRDPRQVVPLIPGAPCPAKSDMLAFMDAFGDLHIQRPLPQHHSTLRIHLRRMQSNRMGAAVKRVIESNEDLGMMVLAMNAS